MGSGWLERRLGCTGGGQMKYARRKDRGEPAHEAVSPHDTNSKSTALEHVEIKEVQGEREHMVSSHCFFLEQIRLTSVR